MIAGLTGGYGSGKTTVIHLFRELGAHVIESDKIAREVIAKGTLTWKEIVNTFGEDILIESGEIDRKKLGDIIFSDVKRRETLNAITHPKILKRIDEQIEKLRQNDPGAIIVVDVPLLFEIGLQNKFDAIIVVTTDEDVTIMRTLKRDNLSRSEILSRISAQLPLEIKRKDADFVIDNNGDLDSTKHQVEGVFMKLRSPKK